MPFTRRTSRSLCDQRRSSRPRRPSQRQLVQPRPPSLPRAPRHLPHPLQSNRFCRPVRRSGGRKRRSSGRRRRRCSECVRSLASRRGPADFAFVRSSRPRRTRRSARSDRRSARNSPRRRCPSSASRFRSQTLASRATGRARAASRRRIPTGGRPRLRNRRSGRRTSVVRTNSAPSSSRSRRAATSSSPVPLASASLSCSKRSRACSTTSSGHTK